MAARELTHSNSALKAAAAAVDDFVASARALLAERNKLRRINHRLDRDGLKPIYCIDNDVLKLYLNPAFMGVPGKRPNDRGYGVIFPEDTNEDAAKIAAVLADYLFDILPDGQPLLQLAPIAEEALDILNGIERDVRRPLDWSRSFSELKSDAVEDLLSQDQALHGEGKGEIDHIAASLMAAKDNETFHAAAEKTIEGFFIKISARLELVRFLSLVATGKVQSSHTLGVAAESNILPQVIEVLSGPSLIADMVEFNEDKRNWFGKLQTTRSNLRAARTLERDARTLALITFINKRIASEGFVLLLISGDRGLHRVLAQTPELRDYVINPRAMLIEALEWRSKAPAKTMEHPFELALSALVSAALTGIADGRPKNLKELQTLYETARGQWASLKEGLPPARLFDPGSYQKEMADIIGSVKNMNPDFVREKLAAIQQDYEDEASGLWKALEDSTLIQSVGISQAYKTKPRNPPTVIFESFVATRKLVLDLMAAPAETLVGKTFGERMASVGKNDVTTEPERKYLHYLVLAMLAGGNGDWRLASILAGRALGFAKEIEESGVQSKVDGREARFVRAQADRLLAADEFELNRAAEDLTKCEKAGAKQARSSPNEYDQIKKLRCQAERISFAIAGQHLATWLWPRSGNCALFESGLAEISQVRDALMSFQPGEPEVDQIKEILLANLFVNAMQVHHLATKMGNGVAVGGLNLAKTLYEYYMQALSEKKLHESFLMRFYRFYFLVGTDSPITRSDRDWFFSSRNDEEIRRHGVTAYDRLRFADLVQRISE